MIIVKIELHSAITGLATEIGRMKIYNDGTGTDRRGNYDIVVLKRRSEYLVQRLGRVEDYPRRSYNVWRLIARAILSAFPEEQDAQARR